MKKWWIFGITVAFLSAGLYYVYRYDPGSTPYTPKCAFYVITGLYCPGCGAQRALHALAHGDFQAAMSYNPLLIICLPYIAIGVFLNIYTLITDKPVRWGIYYNRNVVLTVFLILILYWIARNLPWYPFSLLAP